MPQAKGTEKDKTWSGQAQFRHGWKTLHSSILNQYAVTFEASLLDHFDFKANGKKVSPGDGIWGIGGSRESGRVRIAVRAGALGAAVKARPKDRMPAGLQGDKILPYRVITDEDELKTVPPEQYL